MRIILVLVLVGGLAWFFYKKASGEKLTTVKVGEKEVHVEIADTPAKRARGLMFRRELGKDEGMLFVFENESRHAFWMANTYIPLDIIWLDSEMNVVHVEQNVPPCTETGNLEALCTTYKPDSDAKFVLEVNAEWYVPN